MPKVTFVDPDLPPITVDATPGHSILNVAMAAGALVRTTCGGLARCHECEVTIQRGADQLTPPQTPEATILGERLDTGARLSCQACVGSGAAQEVVVLIPPRKKPARKQGVGGGGADV